MIVPVYIYNLGARFNVELTLTLSIISGSSISAKAKGSNVDIEFYDSKIEDYRRLTLIVDAGNAIISSLGSGGFGADKAIRFKDNVASIVIIDGTGEIVGDTLIINEIVLGNN